MAYLTRTTTAEDVAPLQEVLNHTGLFPSEMLPDMLAQAMEGGEGAFWLTLEVDGTPQGFAFTAPEALAEGTWNMLALAVHGRLQGQGLGATLVAAVEDKLRGQGARLVIADTSGTAEFSATRAFYAARGYLEEARIKNFWGPGDDKVTFTKSLVERSS